MSYTLSGVIAAVVTPITRSFEPDVDRLITRMRYLLDHGCDGINLLGTTGEATSFSAIQRETVMRSIARAGLPMHRVMVGTGAANVRDAVSLSKVAEECGFAAALVLPPFYYKPLTTEGLLRYFAMITEATATRPLPIYLYNFPALSGITYTKEVVEALIHAFGDRIAGLKDSSGDLEYASAIAALPAKLAVFPSNEATLIRARAGEFAGCISATTNLNSQLCAQAFHKGDKDALEKAVAVRDAFAGVPLVPAIKEETARRLQDPAFALPVPPLSALTSAERLELQLRLKSLDG
ncbi:MAG: dihydrodipicolinate synthase family protein [Pseudomonadota bacterium]